MIKYGFLNTMKTHIKLYHNGRHTWNAPVILRIGCSIKVEEFPFDKQTCDVRFGGFTYKQSQLDLIPVNDTADLTKYSSMLSKSLLNYVLKYPRSLRAYVPICFTCLQSYEPLSFT